MLRAMHAIPGVRTLLFCLFVCCALVLGACAGHPALAGSEMRHADQGGITNGLVRNDPGGLDSRVARSPESWDRGQGFHSVGGGSFVDMDDDGLPDQVRTASGGSGAAFVDSNGDGLPDELAGGEPQPKRRLLIYSGSIAVEVARADEACKSFLAMAEGLGGFLQNQTGTTMILRVPAKSFDELFAAARESGRVLSETRSANDVTEEFVDLGIRVDNARRARERLLEVLKLAKEVEDILKVEKELRRVTEEIERMEGRLKFLRDQVAMSTLEVAFRSAQAAPQAKRSARRSRFYWVQRVGAAAVMEGF